MATDVKAPRRSLREDAINLPNLLTMLRVVLIPVVLDRDAGRSRCSSTASTSSSSSPSS